MRNNCRHYRSWVKPGVIRAWGTILSNVNLRLPDSPAMRDIATAIDVVDMALQIAAGVLVYKLIRSVVNVQTQLSAGAATVVLPD